MQRRLIFTVLFFASCANQNQAQQPRWELLARGLYGVIAIDPTNSNVIYVGSRDSGKTGMWKSMDGGQSWNLYKNGWGIGSPMDVLIDPNNPQVILACGGPFVGILKSIDGGQNWVRADTGLVPDHHGYLVWDLALDNQRRIFYAAHDGIFGGVLRSSDGARWRLANSDFSSPLALTVDETGVLYAGTGNGAWKSSDGGNNWTRINNGLPFQSPTPPVTYPSIRHIAKIKNSRTLYCAVTNRGIYKSFDGGANWFSVNDSVTSKLRFWGGLVVAERDTSAIYAGAEATLDPVRPGGIYLSRNCGRSWTLYNFGLADSVLDFHVTNLFLDNRANVLYASIGSVLPNGRSEEHIYLLRDAVVTAVHEPRLANYPAQLILRSYPNPFNNQTIFSCSIHNTGQILLRLFDILGKEVVTLLNEQRGPGEYHILWGGTNAEGKRLPSGIYLAKLQLGNEVKTIKLLFMK